MSDDGRLRESISFAGATLSLPIYLDHQASTPLDLQVREAMAPYQDELYGNPHSRTHQRGLSLHQAIETAREHVAALIKAAPHEIIFTSGATEANNLALLGFLRAQKGPHHVISVMTEHEAILQPLKAAEAEGARVTLLPVDEEGRLDLRALENAIQEQTVLVSVMAANNETGLCHDLPAIGEICAGKGIAFHTDAVQALATQEVDVGRAGLSLLSLSGHKLYGPMGIGALYVKESTVLSPLTFGGNQEGGLRAGTLPTALCVGLGEACRLLTRRRKADAAHILDLRERLKVHLVEKLGSSARFNSEAAPHIPGCLSVTIEGVDAEELLFELPDLALSTGSACSSLAGEPSHVLRAMGLGAEAVAATVRIGIGRETTGAEIDYAAGRLVEVCRRQLG
ncbi:MAG: cysteine desulfurase [Proteobacteria bacterium]|nr:cysteine desulfurase [Pseudomonadota bacterium]